MQNIALFRRIAKFERFQLTHIASQCLPFVPNPHFLCCAEFDLFRMCERDVPALKIVFGDLTRFSTNRDCPFLEFAGVIVVEQDRQKDLRRLATRGIRVIYTVVRSDAIPTGVAEFQESRRYATTGYPHTCQVSRECVELHGVADLLLPTTSSRLSHPLPIF